MSASYNYTLVCVARLYSFIEEKKIDQNCKFNSENFEGLFKKKLESVWYRCWLLIGIITYYNETHNSITTLIATLLSLHQSKAIPSQLSKLQTKQWTQNNKILASIQLHSTTIPQEQNDRYTSSILLPFGFPFKLHYSLKQWWFWPTQSFPSY